MLFASAIASAAGEEELKAGVDLYSKGDYASALLKWRDAASKGNAAAMSHIGSLYRYGRGVKQDYIKSMRWYRKAADKGNATGMFNIGAQYEWAQGVEEDQAEAMRWYRKAADMGSARGMVGVGGLYFFGEGVKQDFAEAMRWYRKAADMGHANGMVLIGSLYRFGSGVKQDYVEAMRWYRQAAPKGHPGAYSVRPLYPNSKPVQLFPDLRQQHVSGRPVPRELDLVLLHASDRTRSLLQPPVQQLRGLRGGLNSHCQLSQPGPLAIRQRKKPPESSGGFWSG